MALCFGTLPILRRTVYSILLPQIPEHRVTEKGFSEDARKAAGIGELNYGTSAVRCIGQGTLKRNGVVLHLRRHEEHPAPSNSRVKHPAFV